MAVAVNRVDWPVRSQASHGPCDPSHMRPSVQGGDEFADKRRLQIHVKVQAQHVLAFGCAHAHIEGLAESEVGFQLNDARRPVPLTNLIETAVFRSVVDDDDFDPSVCLRCNGGKDDVHEGAGVPIHQDDADESAGHALTGPDQYDRLGFFRGRTRLLIGRGSSETPYMCGVLAYRDRGDNSRIRTRGPDATQTLVRAPFTFVHNLLSVTGEFSVQPFEDREVVCLYNGEIYNHPFVRTDGEVLIPLYRRLGPHFARALDGEFAIALYDFAQEIAIFSTDPFKTKPLFINGTECASYRSGVGGAPAQPNETVVVRFDGTVLDRAPVREWDLTQWKEGYDDWLAAFDRSIAKRAKPGCFLGLSVVRQQRYDCVRSARAQGTDQDLHVRWRRAYRRASAQAVPCPTSSSSPDPGCSPGCARTSTTSSTPSCPTASQFQCTC